MSPRWRFNLIPLLEVLVTVVVTTGAFFLAVHYNVASLLDTFSTRARLGFDSADLGPGFFVLSCGLGLMTVRRWKESADERQALVHTRDVLAESEDRYRSLVEMSPAPMVVSDPRRRIVFVNDAALHLLRLDAPDAAIGHSIEEFVEPDMREHAMDLYARTLAGEPVPTEEIRLRRLDGTEVAVQMEVALINIDDVPHVQSVLLDVTHLTEIADALRQACVDTVEAMARLAEARDPYTSGHQARVADLGVAMAEHMGLPSASVQAIHVAGIVHDIGKINVPIEILAKPGRLTEAEFDLIKTHAQLGYEILLPIEFPWPIADIVRQHHERLDGSGYPLGLTGAQMLPESRILAVADVVEAVASDRPYRPARGLAEALRLVSEGRGTKYDADAVDACLAVAGSIISPS